MESMRKKLREARRKTGMTEIPVIMSKKPLKKAPYKDAD